MALGVPILKHFRVYTIPRSFDISYAKLQKQETYGKSQITKNQDKFLLCLSAIFIFSSV